MNGYMIHHETAINRQAKAITSLAAEYSKLIAESEAITKLHGWDSPAAAKQKEEIRKLISEANSTASELRQIDRDLYAFTASHKTWLEDVVDAVTGGTL